MIVRPNAEFLSGFPDDGVEEDGEFVLFPGRTVAEALGAILSVSGYSVTAPQHQWHKGWDFYVTVKGGRVWVLVTDIGETFILQTTYTARLWLFGDSNAHAELLQRLAQGMAADARFENIVWRLERDTMSDEPGADRPVGDALPIAPKRLVLEDDDPE